MCCECDDCGVHFAVGTLIQGPVHIVAVGTLVQGPCTCCSRYSGCAVIPFAVCAVNPSVNVVRKFVHLLDIGENDYAEEFGLYQHLVVAFISTLLKVFVRS